MGVAAQTGQGSEFEFEGQIYRVAPMSFAIRADFESYLKRRVWAVIDSQRKNVDKARFESMERNALRDMAAGVYDWGGEVCVEALSTVDGFNELFAIRLRRAGHTSLTHDQIKTIMDSIGYQRAWALSIDADGHVSEDPNPKAEGTLSTSSP